MPFTDKTNKRKTLNIISNMKKYFLLITLAITSVCISLAQSVIGKWKLDDGTAIVEVYQQGDNFNGRIVWLEEPNDPDGTPAKDNNNPDAKLRSRQLMGLNMLSGLKHKGGNEYGNGSIYDPGNGKTYNCSMKVEGNTLKVRGSLDKRGILGRTMDWFRVK